MYQANLSRAKPVVPASVRGALRTATADNHERLDAMFGKFDLADPAAYRSFLRAHARALLPIEELIAAAGRPDGWLPRSPLLLADLAAIGEAGPSPMPILPPNAPGLWGMRYVVEGSRLGGALLARSVGSGLPAAYLGARHGAGEWRAFLDTLERAGQDGDETWLNGAIEGAREAFALFAAAATEEMAEHG
nr:hypothetical protein [uncultured organism]